MASYKDFMIPDAHVTISPKELDRIDKALNKHGICTECLEPISHHLTEPFASCKCGTMEWSSEFATFQRMQREIFKLGKEIERLKDLNLSLGRK